MVNSPDDDEGDEVPDGPFDAENLPFEQIFASLGIPMPQEGEPIDVQALLASLQNVMARSGQSMTTDGGGVNWAFAKDMARKVVAAMGPDPTPSSRQRHDIADSVHLAELWLNDATIFPAVAAPPAAWSRAEWVENTMATWQTMVEPIVSTIATSLGEVMTKRISDEPELAGMQQMFQPMLQQSASSMFGVQFGQALGKLATEVVSATEVSMPLLPRPQVALLPTNLAGFGDGLDLAQVACRTPEPPLDRLVHGPSGHHVGDQRPHPFCIIRMGKTADGLTDEGGRRHAEDALDHWPDLHHRPAAIDQRDRVGGVRGEGPEARLRLAPRLLGEQAAVLAQDELLAHDDEHSQEERAEEHRAQLARSGALSGRDDDPIAGRQTHIGSRQDPAGQLPRQGRRPRAPRLCLQVAGQTDQERRAEIADIGPALDVERPG